MRFVPVGAGQRLVPAPTSGGASRCPTLLPVVTDDATTIDGTAIDLDDGVTVVDPNGAGIGAGATVGTTGAHTTPQLDPEMEIRNDRGTAVLPTGLAFEADDAVLRHVSIWGFGDAAGTFDANVRFGTNSGTDPDFTGSLAEFNVIGTGPASFTDPGAGVRSGRKNLTMRETDGAIVRDNLIGFAGGVGVDFNSAASSGNVLRNEVRGNGILDPNANPLGVWFDGTVTGNLVIDNAAGIFHSPTPSVTFQDNTITANGWGATRPHGIWASGSGATIQRNVITDNAGAGVMVPSTSSGTSILQNAMSGNGTSTAQIGIDLLASGDDSLAAPYVTANDVGDGDAGGNGLLNFPVVTSAVESGGTVTVDVDLDVPAGDYRVEFFSNPSGADPSGYGEGETFVDFLDVVGHTGGSASYSTTFAGSAGDLLTATTTEDLGASYGSTSEYWDLRRRAIHLRGQLDR